MIYTEQEIVGMVQRKCEEALAPLYAQMKELEIAYGMRKPDPQPAEPQPDPEEVRQMEFKKQLAEMKQMLIKSGRIPKDEAKKNN